jgi:hypothetical protein
MKVYLDDAKPLDTEHSADDGWVRVMSVKEVITLLQTGMVTDLSLDNDLGDQDPFNEGWRILEWIQRHIEDGFIPPKIIKVHTSNVVRRPQMEAMIETIRRKYADRNK